MNARTEDVRKNGDEYLLGRGVKIGKSKWTFIVIGRVNGR